jgi:hypothetical protein
MTDYYTPKRKEIGVGLLFFGVGGENSIITERIYVDCSL